MVKMLDVIYEKRQDGRTIHCVFEYHQQTLAQMINKHVLTQRELRIQKPFFTLEQIQDLMWQLLKGISSLHAMLIMHRDIKPDNILVDS
ncbi:MAG: protein kinase domain-containing protein [Candidatus Roizmanbacteria bacterium]